MSVTRNDWTPDAVEQLKRMHAQDLPFTEIARRLKAMNFAFTRNACIGKAGRLALPKRLTASDVAVISAKNRPPPTADQIAAKKAAKAARERNRLLKPRNRERTGIVAKTIPIASPPLQPKHSARSGLLIDFEWNQCRWPVTEIAHATFLYCTANAERGSYCAQHDAMAHDRPKARMR
jgi:hypothetical protein